MAVMEYMDSTEESNDEQKPKAEKKPKMKAQKNQTNST